MAGEKRGKRVQERINAALPVFLGDARGITRDVSASGVFFETNASLGIGSSIEFSVEFDSPNGSKMVLRCSGDIVRREVREDRVGVAVKIVESKMELAPVISVPERQTAAGT